MSASLWQRLGCCVSGHDYSVRSDGTRMFLQCKACGRTSRGLEMAEDPRRRRARLACESIADHREATRRKHAAA